MRFPKLKFSSNLFAFFLLSVFVLLCIWAILLTSPPLPKDTFASDHEFSAARAFRHIEVISREPHMSGTPQKDSVCSYIVNQLESIGVEVDVQSTTVMDYDGFPVFANITNIAARIRGTGSTKALLIVGHYDTQPHTPGAADDGIAVGSMLEAARIIKAHHTLQNDIIFLFTDAEEVGLLGAEAFAKSHPWMDDVGLVLNLEARGNKGAALTFEVSPENGWIIRECAKAVDRPFAGSMMYEVYRLMPNNTDFTVFKHKGISGFNVAIVEGFVNYHSATDTPSNLSLASLQHMGSYVMSIAKHFGNLPLFDTKSPDLVYFNYFGDSIVYFPSSLNYWLIGFAVFLFLFFIFLGLVRKYIGVGRFILSLFHTLFVIAVVLGAIWGLNVLVVKIYPHYNVFYMSNFYNVEYYYLAYTIVALFFFSVLYPVFTRFIGLYNVMASVFFIFLLISGFIIWKFPTASYLTLIPLIFGLFSLVMLLFRDINRHKRPWLFHFIVILGLLPLIFMISPYIYLIYNIFGLSMPYVGAGLLVVLLLFAIPLVDYIFTNFSRLMPISLFLALIGVLIIAHIYSKPSEKQPLQSNVLYASLADQEKAYWFSSNLRTDEWNAQFFANGEFGTAQEFYPWKRWERLQSEAPFVDFKEPIIEQVYDSIKSDTRAIEFKLKLQNNPVIMEIYLPLDKKLKSFAINGQNVPELETSYVKRINHYFFRLISPNYGGDRVMVEYQGHDSIQLNIIEVIHGLPQLESIKPMPKHIIPATGYESLMTVVLNRMTVE